MCILSWLNVMSIDENEKHERRNQLDGTCSAVLRRKKCKGMVCEKNVALY